MSSPSRGLSTVQTQAVLASVYGSEGDGRREKQLICNTPVHAHICRQRSGPSVVFINTGISRGMGWGKKEGEGRFFTAPGFKVLCAVCTLAKLAREVGVFGQHCGFIIIIITPCFSPPHIHFSRPSHDSGVQHFLVDIISFVCH